MLKHLGIPPFYAQVLRDLTDTRENPFYWRERRRGQRTGQPFQSLAKVVILLAVTLGAIWTAFWGLLQAGTFGENRIPGWLGGQDGGRVTFSLVAKVHLLLVYFAARHAVSRMLRDEASRGTLVQLLMTKIPPFEILAQSIVYPFQQAMLSAVAGLPIYFLLVSLRTVSLHEVAVLYGLFAVVAVAAPTWRTPGFTEQSPEELAGLMREQERSSGCLMMVLIVAGIPGTLLFGSILAVTHYAAPQGAARIPQDVWPALFAFPLTGLWVVVRALSAPYTWFGLPLPLWTWIFGIVLVYKVSTIWMSSLYLRVADVRQIYLLADAHLEIEMRRRLRIAALIGLVGAVWQPFIESGVAARYYWTGAAPGVSASLASVLFWSGIVGTVFSLARLRRAVTSARSTIELKRASVVHILAPLWIFGVGALGSLLAWPSAALSEPVLLAVCSVVTIEIGAAVSLIALGRADESLWLALWMLPAIAGVGPIPINYIACLSPASSALLLVPAVRAEFSSTVTFYHLPPIWLGMLGPILAAALLSALRRFGWLRQRAPMGRTMRVARGPYPAPWTGQEYASGTQHVPYGSPASDSTVHAGLPQRTYGPFPSGTPSAAPDLDFLLDGVELTSEPPVSAAPPIVGSPYRGPGSGSGNSTDTTLPPVIAASAPFWTTSQAQKTFGRPSAKEVNQLQQAGYVEVAGKFVPPPLPPRPVVDWRQRRMSPLAWRALRFIAGRTDNPVAIYCARRELAGTLLPENISMTVAAAAFAVLIAYAVPPVFLALILPAAVTPLLFGNPLVLQDSSAIGFAYLVSTSALFSLISPTIACARVTKRIRAERNASTLGFLLITPIRSQDILMGQLVGVAIPALTHMASGAALGLVGVAALSAARYGPDAIRAWSIGFGTVLVYFILSLVVGAWVGVNERKANDSTFRIYFFLFLLVTLAMAIACGIRFCQWLPYWPCVGCFFAILILELALLWSWTLMGLNEMRRGDVAFEGRTNG